MEKIKEIFIESKIKLKQIDMILFKNQVKSSNNFLNRMKYGPSKVKAIEKYLNSYKVIYITERFICFEEGLACYEIKDGVILSNGFYEGYKMPFMWVKLIEGFNSQFDEDIYNVLNFEKIEKERIEKEIADKTERDRVIKLTQSQDSVLNQLDNDNDGEVDLIENDFTKLFSKNQKRVMDIDKNYIHQFVKVSNFIKTKKQNIQKIFESIRDTSTQEDLEERVNLLRNQIHSYELLIYHSINMIGALVSEDLISFYEIYESFDKLGMFNSNWENEVSKKLTNIGDKLDDLMYSIYNMDQNIMSELSHLSYFTQESFEDLNRSVTSQLKEVKSSINTNNLWTGIQAYQLYKINKNTKSLRN